MLVSRSGYYKWKYPTLKEITRKSDIKIIKEAHEEHKDIVIDELIIL